MLPVTFGIVFTLCYLGGKVSDPPMEGGWYVYKQWRRNQGGHRGHVPPKVSEYPYSLSAPPKLETNYTYSQ